jgi:hypothetical protein
MPAKRTKLATFTILQRQRIVLSLLHTPPGPLAEFSQRTTFEVLEEERLNFAWWLGIRSVRVAAAGLRGWRSEDE